MNYKEENSNEEAIILEKSLQTGFRAETEDAETSPQSDEEAPPEDAIPDLPENREAREFLKKAPSKGLVWLLFLQITCLFLRVFYFKFLFSSCHLVKK